MVISGSRPLVEFLGKIVLKMCSKFTDFALQIYWNHTSTQLFTNKCTTFFRNIFLQEQLWRSTFAYLSFSFLHKLLQIFHYSLCNNFFNCFWFWPQSPYGFCFSWHVPQIFIKVPSTFKIKFCISKFLLTVLFIYKFSKSFF